MTKELEALGKIHDNWNCMNPNSNGCDNNDFKLIEKTLKENERLKTSYLENLLNEESKEYIYKKFTALEIIKEKQVNVFIFLHSGDLATYNDMVEDERKLNQEEFDLLKEVLL